MAPIKNGAQPVSSPWTPSASPVAGGSWITMATCLVPRSALPTSPADRTSGRRFGRLQLRLHLSNRCLSLDPTLSSMFSFSDGWGKDHCFGQFPTLLGNSQASSCFPSPFPRASSPSIPSTLRPLATSVQFRDTGIYAGLQKAKKPRWQTRIRDASCHVQ
jgi:hypothetical protein